MNPDYYYGEEDMPTPEFIPNEHKIWKKEQKKAKFQKLRLIRKAKKSY